MKILQINSTFGMGSTGKICLAVSKLLNERGVENYVLYTDGNNDGPNAIKYATKLNKKVQPLYSRIFGNYGFNSKRMTRNLIRNIESINPDIIHLHNLHSHNCNLNMLFSYLKQKQIKIFWTFHDCWAYTGYCPHYYAVKCNKWISGCNKCVQKKQFSWFFDRSEKLYGLKKQLFTGLNMTIITPSEWLAADVKKSFLKDYPVEVINNGIDLSVFKPTTSNFKVNKGITDKYMVLGVALGWDKRKGLDVFVELSKILGDKYQIVLIGTDDSVDKLLPKNIISIHRTQNQMELAQIYSAADVFFNPTREDNFPTVNIEAISCGLPVVTFNTGGSPEMLNEKTGIIVEKEDIESSIKAIKKVCEEKCFNKEDCIERAKEFDEKNKFKQYVDLYLNYIQMRNL